MFVHRLEHVMTRMAEAAVRSGRDPGEVRLVAVTKTVPVDRIREAVAAGQRLFGENYVQEAGRKLAVLGSERPGTAWHFIGRLQRNKAAEAVRLFDCIESVDSLRLARALSRQASAAGVSLTVYLQVNVAGDPAKSGLVPGTLGPFLEEVSALPRLRVRGLMTIPPWTPDPEEARPWYRALRGLRDRFSGREPGDVRLCELSMGMSHDFEIAIEEGATLIRVGTALFGTRPQG